MCSRELLFDKEVKATGLNPEEIAKCHQPVQIYNPESEKYVMAEHSSPKLSESESNFVCIDESYKGGGKRFLLEHLHENEYHIKTMDNDGKKETGFLYVSENVSSGIIESSANVLRSEQIVAKKELYVFEFTRHSEQKGTYKIKCKGNKKLLFAATDRGNYVKADRRNREKSNQIWFQFNLKPDMDIKTSVVEENHCLIPSNNDLPVYVDEFYNDSKYLYTEPGQDGCMKLASILGKLALKENVDLKVDSEQFTLSSNEQPLIMEPGKIKSIISSLRTKDKLTEKKLQIQFNGNTFEGFKLLTTDSAGSKSVAWKEDEIEPN